MKEYKTITNTRNDFNKELNELIKEGWYVANQMTTTTKGDAIYHSILLERIKQTEL